jgi:hypothetical protein
MQNGAARSPELEVRGEEAAVGTWGWGVRWKGGRQRGTLGLMILLFICGLPVLVGTSGAQVVSSPKTGQDSNVPPSMAWPPERYTVSGDCVTDNLTGLMWAQVPDNTTRTWQQALDYVDGLILCGHDAWRLPSRKDLRGLMPSGSPNTTIWLSDPPHGMSGPRGRADWSSASYAVSTGRAWVVGLWGGLVGADFKPGSAYVWPIREGGAESADLPVTQTAMSDLMGAPANAEAELSEITGRVVRSVSEEQGVGKVTMTLTDPGGHKAVRTTDARGGYRFRALSKGTYTVTPTKGGCTFVPVSKTITVPKSGASRRFVGTCK